MMYKETCISKITGIFKTTGYFQETYIMETKLTISKHVEVVNLEIQLKLLPFKYEYNVIILY